MKGKPIQDQTFTYENYVFIGILILLFFNSNNINAFDSLDGFRSHSWYHLLFEHVLCEYAKRSESERGYVPSSLSRYCISHPGIKF